MDKLIEDAAEMYTAPALSELGTVTEATLGSAGNDQADDTQYWK